MAGFRNDWTKGEPVIQYLFCDSCESSFHLSITVCKKCGGGLQAMDSSGRGECVATTFVPARYSLRGKDDNFCLIHMVEDFRILARAHVGVMVGQNVKVMFERSSDGMVCPIASPTTGNSYLHD